MLLIAAHVLGDIERWWGSHGDQIPADQGGVGALYRLLRNTVYEAEATWSLLPDHGDGSRVFTALNAWRPISVLLIERGEDLGRVSEVVVGVGGLGEVSGRSVS